MFCPAKKEKWAVKQLRSYSFRECFCYVNIGTCIVVLSEVICPGVRHMRWLDDLLFYSLLKPIFVICINVKGSQGKALPMGALFTADRNSTCRGFVHVRQPFTH